MKQIVHFIDKSNSKIGELASWASLFLVLLICADVLMRYTFSWSRMWVIELELYLFAIIFLLGSANAFRADQHVRVDVFYTNMTERSKNLVNLFGGILFLIPWTLVIVYISQRYFFKSLAINEASSQPGGLPHLYFMKSLLVIGFFMLFLQGISSIFRAILSLKNKTY